MGMDGPPLDFMVQRFSTRMLPAKDRLDGWRQIMSRKLISAEVDRLGDSAFRAEASLRIFEEVRFGMGFIDAHINRRGRDVIAQDNDDFLLVINPDNILRVEHRGREFELGPGDAVLLDCSEQASFERPTTGRLRCVRLARASVRQTSRAEDRSARIISRHSNYLAFLISYLDAVDRHECYDSPELRKRITAHIHDLMALLLDARGDARDIARAGGLKAARIRGLKDDVMHNLSRQDLDADALAARHGISTRTLQRLFEQDGMTFTQYLLAMRLERAHRLLVDKTHVVRSVSGLAYECGFSDVSHFNHRFRARYGASPSEVRRQVEREN
jgi:AraC-like DNA-binding protein